MKPRSLVFFVHESAKLDGVFSRPEDHVSALDAIHSCGIMIVTPGKETPERLTFSGEGAEHDGLKTLLEILNQATDSQTPPPQLITYNGRHALMPRLYVAAMIYGLKLGIVGDAPSRSVSYQTRFNDFYHFDIADLISHYGASRAPELRNLAEAINRNAEKEMSDLDVMKNRDAEKEMSDLDALKLIYDRYQASL